MAKNKVTTVEEVENTTPIEVPQADTTPVMVEVVKSFGGLEVGEKVEVSTSDASILINKGLVK